MAQGNPLLMPKLGLTMTEGVLAEWRVQPGDRVMPGDILFVVETEKIATEIEAAAAGSIERLLVSPGQTVAVGAPVALWKGPPPGGESGIEESIAAPEQRAPPAPIKPEPAAPGPAGSRRIATPLARKRARESGIDLTMVTGTGPRGRIKASDVMTAGVTSKIAGRPRKGSVREPTAIEKITAARLSRSVATIPHFYVVAEADVTGLDALRDKLNSRRSSSRITVTHMIIAAVRDALSANPDFSCRWTASGIEALPLDSVGIAVDTTRGLMIPVLRNAGAMSLATIADAAGKLVARARSGRFRTDDMTPAAITISNVGMTGASLLVPVIDPDQSAILGVGRIRPVFRPDAAGKPELRHEMGLVLSCDHRVHSGMQAARFLDRVVAALARLG